MVTDKASDVAILKLKHVEKELDAHFYDSRYIKWCDWAVLVAWLWLNV